jgi:hypothetical protein
MFLQLNDSGFCCERDDSYKKSSFSLGSPRNNSGKHKFLTRKNAAARAATRENKQESDCR